MITPEFIISESMEWSAPYNIPPRLKRVMLWTFPISFPLHIIVAVIVGLGGWLVAGAWFIPWLAIYLYGDK